MSKRAAPTRITGNLALGLPSWVVTPCLIAVLSACSSGVGNQAGTGGSSGAGGFGVLHGDFTVEILAPDPATMTPGLTSLVGMVFDEPQLRPIPLKLDSELNGCQLWVVKVVSCIPGCGSVGVCTATNQCTPYPSPRNIGTVRVQGLGTSDLVMDGGTRNVYEPIAFLPYPPCVEGASVLLDAQGWSAQGRCIAPLATIGPERIPVSRGQGTPLTWTAPGTADISRVRLSLDISQHGGKKGEIVCDIPDTGSFEIPEPLITKLVDLGLAGYPEIVASRVSTATASAQGDVRLVISSPVTRAVDTGVTSCRDETTCAPGQACQDDVCM
jgi:hypothetical protein